MQPFVVLAFRLLTAKLSIKLVRGEVDRLEHVFSGLVADKLFAAAAKDKELNMALMERV